METKKCDITYEFLYWADKYFTEDKLNTLMDLHIVFEDYKATLNPKFVSIIKVAHFKRNLIKYCTFKGYTFNPDYLKPTVSEKNHNNIEKTVNGIEFIYFYISTESTNTTQNNKIMNQKIMEGKLIALDAEFAGRKQTIENDIRDLRIQLEKQWQKHNDTVASLKIQIYEKEQVLSEIRREHTCRKSDIYDCYSASNSH